MRMVAKVGRALQQVFGPCAEAANLATGAVQRRRKFTPALLAQSLVLAVLQDPQANCRQIARMAQQCDVDVSPQAIEQRQTPRLAAFLEELFRRAVMLVVASEEAIAPLLERFTQVAVIDSTTISLPDGQRDRFPGCGARNDGGQAAMKLQVELELKTGALTAVELEPGRRPDAVSDRQHAVRERGSLRITDLGYFNLGVFAEIAAVGAYFLSRLKTDVVVLVEELPLPKLLSWLEGQPAGVIDQPVQVGRKERLPCRLIAWRVPAEQARRRRQKLRQSLQSKHGRQPTREALALCDWSLLITNVSREQLSGQEAIVLYRARWQIELLFKRWKSVGLVGQLHGSSETAVMWRLWARLIAALIQHWLTVCIAWCPGSRWSLHQLARELQHHTISIALSLHSLRQFDRVLSSIRNVTKRTCQQTQRSKPSTFELLNCPDKLNFSLT